MKKLTALLIIGCAASGLAQTTNGPTQVLPVVQTNGIADTFTVPVGLTTNQSAGYDWYYTANRKAYKAAVDAWNANTNNVPVVFSPLGQAAFNKLWIAQMAQSTGDHLYRQLLASQQEEAELQSAWKALRQAWSTNPAVRISILQAAGVPTNSLAR